jgi:BirA family biotin operon repressor/biotin-[acetyl-CoA-carboxylase] ligase
VHSRRLDSTNTLARRLAVAGAPHGTLVTTEEQIAGRGRQGRSWSAPRGQALLCSWVLRDQGRLLSLAAGVAVARACGPRALIKWPNDVLIDGRKVAGILVEGRPQERWAVLGIGINVAVELDLLPIELVGRAGTLGLNPQDRDAVLSSLRTELGRWLTASDEQVLSAVRGLDALRDRRVRWDSGSGTAAGVDQDGALLVRDDLGHVVALDAGEVHLLGST